METEENDTDEAEDSIEVERSRRPCGTVGFGGGSCELARRMSCGFAGALLFPYAECRRSMLLGCDCCDETEAMVLRREGEARGCGCCDEIEIEAMELRREAGGDGAGDARGDE